MKNGIIKIAGVVGVTIATAIAGKVGTWLWDSVLEEKANELVKKFRRSKRIKFKIIRCYKKGES